MPTLTSSLCWATPVEVEVLGAHLEAYIELLPVISALRLCHRFGRASHTGIAKLPPELIAVVEDILTKDARSRHLAAWKKDFACFELRCDPSDHLEEEELDALRDDAFDYLDEYDYEDEEDFFIEVESDVHRQLCDDLDLWMGTHTDRLLSWETRTGLNSTLAQHGVFANHAKLIRQHFGLEVWISHVRLEHYPEKSYWWCIDYEPSKTTLAYLTLPTTAKESKSWTHSQLELDDPGCTIPNSQAMSVELPNPICNSQIVRFDSMMIRLGLEPIAPQHMATSSTENDKVKEGADENTYHQTEHSVVVEQLARETQEKQKDDDQVHRRGARKGECKSSVLWPQLMMLTQCAW